MKEKSYFVYKHTSPSGKTYVGITCQKPHRRWNNGRGYLKNKYFYSAICKYGWDNIRHEILFSNLSKDEAEQKEIEMIQFYKSNKNEFGYNIESGGTSAERISEETRLKLSKAKKGKPSNRKGVKLNEEIRKKLSKAHKGIRMSVDSRRKIGEALGKKVICLETGCSFVSAREAERQMNIHSTHIREVCNGKRNTAGGYHWKFID